MIEWLTVFTLTVLVELAVAFPILALEERGRTRHALMMIVAANLLTHPLVFALSALPSTAMSFFAAVLVLELFAAIVEAIVYRRTVDLPLAIAASFIANAASLAVSIVRAD